MLAALVLHVQLLELCGLSKFSFIHACAYIYLLGVGVLRKPQLGHDALPFDLHSAWPRCGRRLPERPRGGATGANLHHAGLPTSDAASETTR